MTKTLPQNFFFGAAMSGPQTEGAYTKGPKKVKRRGRPKKVVNA